MKKHYGTIDGLRAIAALGIVMMHMQANNTYEISGYIYNKIIPSLTNFVFLFMTVSAFGMCCGYYDKIINSQISVSDFYSKRFTKILPFFGILVLLDIIISPSISALYEGFADMTLMFGFLPNSRDISVIGVGWFLGLIFVFYLCFPFFCYLLEKKKRAWFAFVISIIYNFVCENYFHVDRANILYSACFFLAGGLIYLYREEIQKWNRWIILALVFVTIVLYYIVGGNAMMCLAVSVILLMYAICSSKGILENKVTKFFSSISMEIYLSHMVIFRIIEKLKLNSILGTGWLQYITTVVIVMVGVSLFAVVMKKIIKEAENIIVKYKA